MYQLSPKEQQAIIKHCYEVIDRVNMQFVQKHGVRPNNFLSQLFDYCVWSLLNMGKFEISNDDIKVIYARCRNAFDIENGFLDGIHELHSISEDDEFLYKRRMLIE